MAAFNFPNSPSTNDLHTENNVTWKWNGTVWKRIHNSYLTSSTLDVSGIGTFGGNLNIADTIVHTGDTNTKIRFPAADTVTAEVGGVELLRVNSSGVSIKNSTNTSAFCVGNIRGTASAPSFNETNHDGLAVDVYNEGNPYERHISLAARGYGTTIADMSFWTDSGSSVVERLRITSTGTAQFKGNIEVDTGSAGMIDFGDITSAYGRLYADSTGTFIGSKSNHPLILRTNNIERLRILSDGKLLLGATSASNDENFRIHTGSGSKAIMKFTNTDTGSAAGDGFEFGLGSDEVIEFWNKENTDIKIATNNTERLRITSDGKIGIGNNSPSWLLHLQQSSGTTTLGVKNTGGNSTVYVEASSGNTAKLNVFQAGTSGYSLQTGGTDALQIFRDSSYLAQFDSSGRLLIGTTTEGNSSADDLTVATSGTTGITIRSGTSNTGNIYFSDATSGTGEFAGAIEYAHNGNSLRLHTNSGEKLRIDSNGCVRVGNTATETTSGNTKRIALGAKGSIQGWVSGQLNGCVQLLDNYYWDGSHNKVIEADYCAYLSVRSGTLRFGSTNSSQTAGQNVSGGINERFRIQADGQIKKPQGANRTSLNTYNSNADAFWLDHYQFQDAGEYRRYTDIVSIGDGSWGSHIRVFGNDDSSGNAIERLHMNHKGYVYPTPGGGCIMGVWKYKQTNQSQNYEHIIRGPYGNTIATDMDGNSFFYIEVAVHGTGTGDAWCEYHCDWNSSETGATLTHVRGNNGASSNRPYIVLNNNQPYWKMNHNGGYTMDIKVSMMGGKTEVTYTGHGAYTSNP